METEFPRSGIFPPSGKHPPRLPPSPPPLQLGTKEYGKESMRQ